MTNIIAPARGGLFAGVIASHWFGVPLIPVHYSAPNGRGQSHHTSVLPDLNGSSVLIIDDIADSGHTLQALKEHFGKQNKVVTAAIYHRHSSIIMPDLVGKYLNHNDFVYFPWEVG